MDEKQLSILQIQTVLGMSYPTALKWAKGHGTKVFEHGRDKWYVPASSAQSELNSRKYAIQKLQDTLDTICTNGQS